MMIATPTSSTSFATCSMNACAWAIAPPARESLEWPRRFRAAWGLRTSGWDQGSSRLPSGHGRARPARRTLGRSGRWNSMIFFLLFGAPASFLSLFSPRPVGLAPSDDDDADVLGADAGAASV